MIGSNGGARIGVLGGAFNPPHNCHVVLARQAADQLGLGRVLLVTTGEAPHKEIEDDPGAEVRFEMTQRAAAADVRLDASPVEVEREGHSYTWETLEELSALHPRSSLVLLLGADVAATMPEIWRRPERIVELATLGIAERPGIDEGAVRAALDRIGAVERAEMIRMPRCEVSSTMVRERAAAGEPLGDLLPEPVASLIEERGLYRR